MIYEQTMSRLKRFKKIYTKDIDQIANEYTKDEVDVSELFSHISENGALHRIYFVVSLNQIKDYEKQIEFIEKHFASLGDWWHVDILNQLLVKPVSFAYVYQKAKQYVAANLLFVRRWGYVIFLNGMQKDPQNTKQILQLMHNDDEYYVQMAEAWLIADLAIYNPEVVLAYLNSKKLDYRIIGKAIQKICDSYRISDEVKAQAKNCRKLYK